jgi:hypothetical protein
MLRSSKGLFPPNISTKTIEEIPFSSKCVACSAWAPWFYHPYNWLGA